MIKRIIFKKPFLALIDVTNNCNLRCRHCFHKNFLYKGKEVSIEEWGKRFQGYKEKGIKAVILVGGEASLRLDVLELAQKYFPLVSVYTNGLIKIPEDYDYNIFLSIDGFKERHDKIRGEGVFEKAIANYKGDKRVVIACVFSKLNYSGKEDFQNFIDWVRNTGFRGMTVDFYIPDSTNKESYKIVLNQKEIEEIGEVVSADLKRKDKIIFCTKDLITRQVNNNFSKICVCRDLVDTYGVDGREKRCVCADRDCNYCRLVSRHKTPFWQVWNQISHAREVSRLFFK